MIRQWNIVHRSVGGDPRHEGEENLEEHRFENRFRNVVSRAHIASAALMVVGCSGAENGAPPTENIGEEIAAGCTSVKPIWVGVACTYPDNYTVHAGIESDRRRPGRPSPGRPGRPSPELSPGGPIRS